MKDSRPLASRKEVAAYLGIPAQRLATWAHQGIGPKYVKVGRSAKYSWTEIEAYVKAQTVDTAA